MALVVFLLTSPQPQQVLQRQEKIATITKYHWGFKMTVSQWAARMSEIMAESDGWKVDCMIAELKKELTGEEKREEWWQK